MTPPSTTTSEPVTKEESLEAWWSMALAISAALAGTRAILTLIWSRSENIARASGVMAYPGWTELTRMLSLAYWDGCHLGVKAHTSPPLYHLTCLTLAGA